MRETWRETPRIEVRNELAGHMVSVKFGAESDLNRHLLSPSTHSWQTSSHPFDSGSSGAQFPLSISLESRHLPWFRTPQKLKENILEC